MAGCPTPFRVRRGWLYGQLNPGTSQPSRTNEGDLGAQPRTLHTLETPLAPLFQPLFGKRNDYEMIDIALAWLAQYHEPLPLATAATGAPPTYTQVTALSSSDPRFPRISVWSCCCRCPSLRARSSLLWLLPAHPSRRHSQPLRTSLPFISCAHFHRQNLAHPSYLNS